MDSMPTVAAGTLGGTPSGTWRIDPVHSSASFSVRNLMSKVRGRFRDVDGTGTVVGDLTIRGITRQVRLEAELLRLDATGLQGEPRIGFEARTAIRRSDFHVGECSAEGSKVVVGDTVPVELDVEAYPEKADPEGATS